MVFSFLYGGELYHDGKAEPCRTSGGGAEAISRSLSGRVRRPIRHYLPVNTDSVCLLVFSVGCF